MNLSNIILKAAGRLKPVLLKIFPQALLKKMKGKMVADSHKKLLHVQLQPFERVCYKDGVNLIGNIKAETGLGQSCRLVATELEQSKLSFSVYQYNQLGLMSNAETRFDKKITRDLPYNINLIHINPHELGLAYEQLGHKVWDKRYNIGFWLWELEEFPDEWTPCFHCLDEIWTPSEFISRAIRKKTNLPVITVPYHVEAPINTEYTRRDFGLPDDRYLFLMMYDRTSSTARKNPEAVIQAYKRAFNKDDKVGLVIKINNCNEEEMQILRVEMQDCANVYFIRRTMDRDHVNSLIKCVDAVVSLHRAEGFGLVLAEAMALGTPTVATNWSSNTEFMTEDTSCLVDCRMVELECDLGFFKKGNRWADPDIAQAAEYMKRLYQEPEYGRQKARCAKEYIENKLGMKRITGIIEKRIGEIYETMG